MRALERRDSRLWAMAGSLGSDSEMATVFVCICVCRAVADQLERPTWRRLGSSTSEQSPEVFYAWECPVDPTAAVGTDDW